MLSNTEMLEAIELAKEQGFISEEYRESEEDPMPCDSSCTKCPASKTCKQLTDGKNYSNFLVNCNKLMLEAPHVSKSDQLSNILDNMRSLDNSDQEAVHIAADDLLVDALKLMSVNTINKDIVNKLIEEYTSINKWYA